MPLKPIPKNPCGVKVKLQKRLRQHLDRLCSHIPETLGFGAESLLDSHCGIGIYMDQISINKPLQGYVFIKCEGGGGDRGFVESIYRSYTVCIWPASEPTKLLYHPKQNPRRGGGLRHINTCRQVPLLGNF
jgi:hypothetical protein